MKLYQHPMSPPCRRVLATVYHLNAPVEMMSVDFGSGQMDQPDYRRMNPNGAAPVLDDQGFYLWESTAIMGYLCDRVGGSDLYPKELQKRADVNRWMAWSNCHFGPATGTLTWENAFKAWFKMGTTDEKEVASATEDFHRYAKVLDAQLANHKWICGDTMTIADFTIGANMMYSVPGKFPMDGYKNIVSWYQRLEGTDAWKKSTPPNA